MNENLFQERLRELEAAQPELSEVRRVGSNMLQRAGAKAIAASKKAAKERELAAAAEPKDKITHKDVLVKRGVIKAESVDLEASVEEGKKPMAVPKNESEQGVAEGLAKYIKRLATGKDVKSRAGQEITKAQQASMTGDNKTAHKHFKRYDKLDKLANKEQGVAEGLDEFEESVNDDDYYIVNHDKKHIARRISGKNAKVEFHTDLSKHFKADIDSANKKHGAGHVVIKGMDLKHKGEYSRVTEDVEQIEELSKGTLGRYIKKASDDFPQHQHTADEITKTANPHKPLPDKATKALNKVWRRKMGIHGAVDRLTKEEFNELIEHYDQLDELSKEKLAWYLKKATKHIDRKGENMVKRDKKLRRPMNPLTRHIGGLVIRQDSIASASKKFLAKEGVDQLDELSKETLTSYRDAAKDRRKEHNSAIQRASSIKDTMGDENGRLEKAIEYHSKEHDRLGGKMKIAARKIKKIKEGVEQVSELSKTTLASYYAKSISDRHSKDLARDSAKRKGDEKETGDLGRKVANRSSGIEKAKAKFFKEEADPTN